MPCASNVQRLRNENKMDIDLIAAHLTGDYLLQSDHMARNKLADWHVRLQHVSLYTLPFALIAAASRAGWRRALLFVILVFFSHFITDSRRWASAGSWAPKPIIIDQSLHIVSLAVLKRLLST